MILLRSTLTSYAPGSPYPLRLRARSGRSEGPAAVPGVTNGDFFHVCLRVAIRSAFGDTESVRSIQGSEDPEFIDMRYSWAPRQPAS